MIYFTSDMHFGHNNIIKLCQRPFSSAEEMDNCMIENWNKLVKAKDEIYILGDIAWGEPDKYLKQLNGKKYLNYFGKQMTDILVVLLNICPSHVLFVIQKSEIIDTLIDLLLGYCIN